MKKWLATAVAIGLLTGCSSAETPAPSATPYTNVVASASKIVTLQDALSYAWVAEDNAEIGATANKLSEFVADAELPATVNNEIQQDLIALEKECFGAPETAPTNQTELRRIANLIAVVI